MAQARLFSNPKVAEVQVNYIESQTPTDDQLEFIDEERKAQILSSRGGVNLIVETKLIKQALENFLISRKINPTFSRDSLTISISHQDYLSFKRYVGEHANQFPMQFNFTENHFPAQMRFGQPG